MKFCAINLKNRFWITEQTFSKSFNYFGFAGTCGHLEREACPEILLLGDAQGRDRGIRALEFRDQLRQVLDAADLLQVDDGLDGLPLAEVVLELERFAGGRGLAVTAVEPVIQELDRGVAGPGVECLPPLADRGAEILDDRIGDGRRPWTRFAGSP